jgi:membrane fusion protein, multidrug efflux system
MTYKQPLLLIAGSILLVLVFIFVLKPLPEIVPVRESPADSMISIAIAHKQKLAVKNVWLGSVDAGAITMQTAGTNEHRIDTSMVKINVLVAEREALKLKPGDRVEVIMDLYPQHIFAGRLVKIARRANRKRTYPVEISVANSGEYPLEPGMIARVSFTSWTPDETLVIPRTAIIGDTKKVRIFRIKRGIVQQRIVIIGRQSDDFLEVLNGVSQGDTIIVRGQENIKAGTRFSIPRP